MGRIKFKQIVSNLHYNEELDQLTLSGSKVPTAANQVWNETTNTWETAFGDWDGTRNSIPDFVISGSTVVTPGVYSSGSLSINGLDTFGDSGSFNTIDLGEF
jgi:hypothetical protein